MTREGLIKFLAALPARVVAMEACCGAHYLGRTFEGQGHTVRLISPEYVAPYVKAQKTDDRDAEAIAEAATGAIEEGRTHDDARRRLSARHRLGRKNWLFAGSEAGGTRAAAIFSVIETAKMNGLEPQAYIADVIAKIAADWPSARWDELVPRNWQTPSTVPLAQVA